MTMCATPPVSGSAPSLGYSRVDSVAPRASNAAPMNPAESSSWWRTTTTRMRSLRLPAISFGAKLLAMTEAVDLTDLDMWARGVPYDEFARLRRESPVAWHDEAPPNSGFWSVCGYSDIVAASRDVATFSSARGISFEEPTDEDMAARRTIIDTDPPEHTKLRKIVSGAFSIRAVAVYQHFVEGLTEQVLDAALTGPVLAGEAFDFVDTVAKEVPIRVLARIMGLPEADLDSFIDLGDRLIANTDPDITDVVWGRDDTDAYRRFPFRSPYGKQLWDLGRAIVADRLRDPGDDLLSRLLRAEVDGDRLSETDLDNFFSILVIAGNETTRIAIAQGVLAFCEYPEQWDRLRADPGLLDPATDEVLRWSCPTHFMRRTATRGHRTGRGGDTRGGQGRALVCVRQPGRGGVRRPRRVRCRAGPQPAPELRPGRAAPVPGRPPGPAGGADRARRAGPAGGPVRAGRRAAPDPVELHQRPQGPPGPGNPGLTGGGHTRWSDRSARRAARSALRRRGAAPPRRVVREQRERLLPAGRPRRPLATAAAGAGARHLQQRHVPGVLIGGLGVCFSLAQACGDPRRGRICVVARACPQYRYARISPAPRARAWGTNSPGSPNRP